MGNDPDKSGDTAANRRMRRAWRRECRDCRRAEQKARAAEAAAAVRHAKKQILAAPAATVAAKQFLADALCCARAVADEHYDDDASPVDIPLGWQEENAARGRVDHSAAGRLFRSRRDAWPALRKYVGDWLAIEDIVERATRYVALLGLLLHDDQADEPPWSLTPERLPVRDLSPGVARIRAYALLTAGPPVSPAPTHRGRLQTA